jgi:ectoine hydroxylase-related dioxygenase (phytanoyl-CoA dioxygenase family)
MKWEDLTAESIFAYDGAAFKFQEILKKTFGCDDLNYVHKTVPESENMPLLTFENDQSTVFHRRYYDSPLLDEFLAEYRRFVYQVVSPHFDGDQIVFQKKPTFRVQLPNNVAVGAKHRDADYNHPPSEINFWLPFTTVFDTNGMFTETAPDRGDFHPIALGYGECFRFYGSKCWHYNAVNTTGISRVSVDFRVIPMAMWETGSHYASVKSGMRFDIGSYYDVMDVKK